MEAISSNWGLIGHEWAVALLRQHVARDTLRHAYLFTGPQGVGRRTLALRLAQAINCLSPLAPGEPCCTCRSCSQFEKMQHPDLSVVQAEPPGSTLKVDQVRDLQRSLFLAPYAARFRVALLLRFEDAHPSAANALLKTLEEPPAQVIMLLTAESPESLLPTIVSRCETVRLRPPSPAQLAQSLQTGWAVEAEQAGLLAHISSGRPGSAVRMLQSPDLLKQRQSWLDEHRRMLGSSRLERFALAEKMTERTKDKEAQRQALHGMLQDWLSLWRDVLLRAAGASAAIANLDRAGEVDALAERFGLATARRVAAAIENTLALVDENINTRLAVEILLLDLPVARLD